jgi:glycine hydroxymethyltransferase
LADRIATTARALATELRRRGHTLLTGGTDTHMILIDLRERRMSGLVAERALQECGVLANKNTLPGDTRPPLVTSGLRLGTNILAQRGMQPHDMADCADLVDRVLAATEPTGDRAYRLSPRQQEHIRDDVSRLCRAFPVPSYQEATA